MPRENPTPNQPDPPGEQLCGQCGGSGEVPDPRKPGRRLRCPACQGRGRR